MLIIHKKQPILLLINQMKNNPLLLKCLLIPCKYLWCLFINSLEISLIFSHFNDQVHRLTTINKRIFSYWDLPLACHQLLYESGLMLDHNNKRTNNAWELSWVDWCLNVTYDDDDHDCNLQPLKPYLKYSIWNPKYSINFYIIYKILIYGFFRRLS